MSLIFKEIENDKEWDEYVFKMPNYSFLNSSARFQYNKTVGIKTYRTAIFDNEKLKGIISCNVGTSKLFGNFLECKHSPLFLDASVEDWIEVMEYCNNVLSSIEWKL